MFGPANGSRAERSEEILLVKSISHLLREVKVLKGGKGKQRIKAECYFGFREIDTSCHIMQLN